MSRMVPQETINVLRDFNDVSVELYGIDVKLFVPNNLTANEPSDAYVVQSDIAYTSKDTKVFIEWSPEAKRLRKLGIYMENETPIIAWFKNIPDVKVGTYIKVPIQYVPGIIDTDEFDVVDIKLKGMYDAEVLKAYKLAPRRVK
jgi:hypothetical protein